MKLPPIKLRRLYANKAQTGDFILRPEPLPMHIWSQMTEREHVERRCAELQAVSDEWARLRSTSARNPDE